jgi:hypothetical protein
MSNQYQDFLALLLKFEFHDYLDLDLVPHENLYEFECQVEYHLSECFPFPETLFLDIKICVAARKHKRSGLQTRKLLAQIKGLGNFW